MAQIDIDKFVISFRRCFGEVKGIATTLDRCLFSQGLKYVDTPTGGRLERVDQPTMLENQSKNPKSLKERIGCEADCTIKQEWSEYDEKMLLELSQCCDLNKTQVQWLLSLKDRVQPQPEQGWSEEDEIMIKVLDSIIRYIVEIVDKDALERFGTNREELFSWLKSLRPQSHWKPDSSMLICLEYAIKHINKDGDKRILSKLLEQLKKLKD